MNPVVEHRWYSGWDPHIPKTFEPVKPLSEYLRDIVRRVPDKIAITFYGYDITYRELDQAIDRFARGLVSLGVTKGERVALFMQNCPQFVIAYFGILRAGGIAVALSPMFKHAELEYELKDCEAKTLVAMDILWPEVTKAADKTDLKNVIVTSLRDYLPGQPTLSLPPEMEQSVPACPGSLDFLDFLRQFPAEPICNVTDLREDIALLQYTGGTTGLPKGAITTHHQLAHNVVIAPMWYGYRSEDVFAAIMPFFHCTGMVQTMGAALISGARQVLLTRFSAQTLAQAIHQYRCTVLKGTTTILIALLQLPDLKRYDLSSLRMVTYGGAVTPTEVVRQAKAAMPNAQFGEGYALTETMAVAVFTPLHRPKFGTVGIPNISTDVRIVDLVKGTKEVSPGEEGEVTIKGPVVMKGYWNQPDETRKALRRGWLYTGDIGRMDDEGYVTIVGRKKELIKCSGFSVFPTEVEELLHRHPAVAEVSVIGVPDPYRGESPKAFIVLKTGYEGKVSERQIMEWAKENMSAYKRPQAVVFRSELPKSSAGKVLRRILAEEEQRSSSSVAK